MKQQMKRIYDILTSFISTHSIPILILITVAVLVFPFLTTSRYVMRIATLCLFNIMLALSLNLITGYMGQMSFGQAAFWGIGAYTSSILITRLGVPSIFAYIAAILVSGGFGYLVALPSLKLKGYYLTIVTMGFCEIIRLIELNWTKLTGGALGIMNIPVFEFFGLKFKSPRAVFYLAFALLVLITLLVRNLVNSTYGLSLRAIRDDDDAAELMGIDIVRIKRLNFVISAMIAGVSGALYAQYVTFIHPSIFTTGASQEMLIMIIFGGLGSIPGTFLGAIVLTLLPELLRSLLQYRMMIYGVLMVILMIVKPDGLLGSTNFDLIRKKIRAEKKFEHKRKGIETNEGGRL